MIVRVGAEGGNVTLFGRKKPDQQWEFRRAINDSSLSMLYEEEDGPDSSSQTLPEFVWTTSWVGAVALLDRYPWAQLVPLAVHVDFRADVLVEVTRRLLAGTSSRARTQMDRWLAVCSSQ